MRDLKLAARQLWRSPGFALTVLVTLALSIGANTAIFSIMNALLLKQLPYAQPERMGTVYLRVTGTPNDNGDSRETIDGEQWELLRDQVPSLLSAVYLPLSMAVTLRAGSQMESVRSGRVSAHYFDVLAVRPMHGRNFTEDEDRPHAAKAAILSYTLWHNAFHDDPHAIGQSVLLKGEPHTVVGVLPDETTTPMGADVYQVLQPSREGEGRGTNFYVVVRLRDGAPWQQADAELNRAWANSAQVRSFAQFNSGERYVFHTVPLQQGETDTLRPQVIALMLAAFFILLIACANLAGLTLVRMLRRTRDIATRLALGASYWQIQRQVWTENILLALAGGAAGVAVGFALLRGLLLLLPPHFLPVPSVALDMRVLGFTFGLSLVTSILFGMLPALTTRKLNVRSAMSSHSVIGSGSVRVRQGLIAGEVALTIVLLAAAGLLIRTLVHLETLPPGFNPNGVLAAKMSLDNLHYHDPAAFRKLLNDSLSAMRQIPGVHDAAYGLSLPYERALLSSTTVADGKEAGTKGMTNTVYVSPGYFNTLQIPVLAGRAFTDADGPEAQHVVIVNQSFARLFFHGSEAVGRYINKNTLVVGVVGDTVLSTADTRYAASGPLTNAETMYLPAAQITDPGFLPLAHGFFQPSWIVRAPMPPAVLAPQLQRALASADSNLLFSGFYGLNDLMAETLRMQRVELALLVAMASLALLLSGVGIFALVANMVAQRKREIGIRMALGSTIERAMLNVGSSGVIAAAVGLALGLILCAGTLRAMRSVVWGVGVFDGLTMTLVIATLAAVTLLATVVPASRVAKIDPATALRDE